MNETPDVVLAGRFDLPEEKSWRHVPFEIPPGVDQIHIRMDYTDRIASDPELSGGNTLDIGLFDWRGHAAGSPGYRGWSGSDKLSFTVGRDWATPPYRPGQIEPGTWFVLLGPYKIGPNGLDYTVEIWFNPGIENDNPEPGSILPSRRAAVPAAAEPGWLRGDLHSHTFYSDGDSWPAELLAAAGEAGLDFLGVTDHNSARRPSLPNGRDGLPILISGTETTTYGGHWNAWGVDRWFEFRDPTPAGTQAAFDDALAAGALVSINHPKLWGPAWTYPGVTGNHAIEIWNGPWLTLNAMALAYWDAALKQGKRPVAVGGSDTHHLKSKRFPPVVLGNPTTWVKAGENPNPAAILAAIRRGECFVSESPAGPQLYFDRGANGLVRIRVVGAKGAAAVVLSDRGGEAAYAVDSDDWSTELAYPEGRLYLRAQVVGAAGAMLAVSNPVWPD